MNTNNQNNEALFCIVMDHLSVTNMIAAGLILSNFSKYITDTNPILRVPFTELNELFNKLLNKEIPSFNELLFVGFTKAQSDVLIRNALKKIKLSKENKELISKIKIKVLSDPFKKPETNEFLNPKNSVISQVHYLFDPNYNLDSTIATINMFYDKNAKIDDLYKIFFDYSFSVNILYDEEIFDLKASNTDKRIELFLNIFEDIVEKGRNLLDAPNVHKHGKEIIMKNFNILMFPWLIRRYITLGFDVHNLINGFHYVIKGSLINKSKGL